MDPGCNTAIDHYASRLWDLGHHVVFHCDLCHLDKKLTRDRRAAVAAGMHPHSRCSSLMALLEFARGMGLTCRRRRSTSNRTSLSGSLDLRRLGVWHTGDELLPPLTYDCVADMRENPVGSMSMLFPECRFHVLATGPDGTTTELSDLRRQELHEAIAGSFTAEIHDVTVRPQPGRPSGLSDHTSGPSGAGRRPPRARER